MPAWIRYGRGYPRSGRWISRASAICRQSQQRPFLVGERTIPCPSVPESRALAARLVQHISSSQPRGSGCSGSSCEAEHPAEPDRLRGRGRPDPARCTPDSDLYNDGEHGRRAGRAAYPRGTLNGIPRRPASLIFVFARVRRRFMVSARPGTSFASPRAEKPREQRASVSANPSPPARRAGDNPVKMSSIRSS